ncbi:hypothetical protein MSG28_014374 [Choristoneura fumiferana]|uniref:Uncharacterized protein n=2 Tax=Choristoneura fumiferana TaxID=7141 RepID=A0ACC0JH15_CHOFU|nr:hypothetical protein MSG28_014374 [Choristoneura fumiferana]KAI8423378.1 hypothetical protein MSG28_014374 [Choristoneura fumiferana]
MTDPDVHNVHDVAVSAVTEINSAAYDAVVVVTQPGAPSVQALEDFIAAALQLDRGLEKNIAVLSCPRVSGGRLVLSPTGPITPYDDVRSVYEAARAGIVRAAAAGARRPVLPLQVRESFPAQAHRLAALGVGVSRDIGGADPERMTPAAVAAYVRGAFGPAVRVRVLDDPAAIAKNYPLFEAVNRCANKVDRHKGLWFQSITHVLCMAPAIKLASQDRKC